MGPQHPDDLRFAFRSERLVFRALEDNDVDKQFIFECNNDPIVTAMSGLNLVKPESMAGFEKFMAFHKTCSHAVIACLPPLLKDADGKEDAAGTRMAPRDVGTAQLKDTVPIGFVQLGMHGSPGAADHHRCANLGIAILSPFQGKGYGGEMINWMLDWAFRRQNLHRVELGCWSYNANAVKLYRSLGFVEEGRSREAVLHDRKWWDIVHFGMLENEWEKLRGISN